MRSRRGGYVGTSCSHHPARPAALQSSNRAALYFVPPSQGEGAEGGGGCVGRSPALPSPPPLSRAERGDSRCAFPVNEAHHMRMETPAHPLAGVEFILLGALKKISKRILK